MKLFYAHYPSLEQAFLRYVSTQRKHVLEPWLVVCASSFLAQRLADLLAKEQGIAANFHFVTPQALLAVLDSQTGPQRPVFPQDHLRDFLLKEILNEPGMNRYPVSRGFVQALKSSLRDLADSLADPSLLMEYLQTASDPVLEQDRQRLEWIVRVYERYTRREANVAGYRAYREFFDNALEQIPTSSYLKNFSQLVWYGFYDMSGRQLELFKQMQLHYPLTVFAPYADLPSYRFAKKFFETNWLGSSPSQNVTRPTVSALDQAAPYLFAPQGSAPSSKVRIVSAADPSGEVFFAAKEILNLVEKQGFSFEDIAVITRTSPPYQEDVRRVFAQNCIPLNASFTYALAQSPFGVFCLNLFSMVQNGFERETVLALLSSPYFNRAEKETWYALAERSLVSRDLNQWRDLLPITEGFDPSFLHWLQSCQQQLTKLDAPCPWTEAAQLALAFFKENVAQTALQGKEAELFESVCACITSLGTYGVLRPLTKPGEFIRELLDALNSLSFHTAQAVRHGVVFTDIQRARGLSFRAVFLLGVTEKSFPMLQPEDPILRDRYRYILRDILGFWINQQSERADEERLLFFLAAASARERLYACYARADSDGKETVPSVYLAELARAAELSWKTDQAAQISGRISQRLQSVPVEFLTPKEISYACILSPQTSQEGYRAAGLLTPEKQRALQAAASLRRVGELTEQDGIISTGKMLFERLNRGAGFSPSALEELAACPMKFFFHRGLHLEEKEACFSRQEMAPDKRGSAYHQVLQDFYQQLLRLGLTHQLFDSGVAAYIARSIEKYYTLQSGQAFGIYPLIWELLLEQMQQQLTAFAQEDVKNLGKDMPSFFEQEFSKLNVPGLCFTLRGIIDRIDINEPEKTFKIADYKLSKKGGSDLGKAFFTHLLFQPFLYVLAAEKLPLLQGYRAAGSCLLSIRKSYCRRDLSMPELEALRPRAEAFLNYLAELVQNGLFFIHPCESCTYCPYRFICRKDSFASLMRAGRSAPSRKMEEMRNVPA